MPTSPPVLLYDGACGLCNGAVQWLLRHDPKRVLRCAPLQGETADALRGANPEIPPDLDSVVLVDGDRIYQRSAAFIHLAPWLPFPWRLARLLGILPPRFLDAAYDVVARLRYRVFGRHDPCAIPSPEQRSLFLP